MREKPKVLSILSIVICLLGIPLSGEVDFQKDIKPILTKKCLNCHGPKKQKGTYRVDVYDSLFNGGDSEVKAIIPKDLKNSNFIFKITTDDEDEIMPPEGKPQLTQKEKSLLKKWIKEGAKVPEEFKKNKIKKEVAFIFKPLIKVNPPNIKDPWIKNNIDKFILQKLNTKKLRPNQPADKRTLIKRIHLTLTGLLPDKKIIENFTKDASPKAFETAVDQALLSRHYGENWGQHWLDIVRYAESDGFERNLIRHNAWHYRDYVIESFNKDTPYHKFIMEQIAGEQMGKPEATGFLVAGAKDTVVCQVKSAERKKRLDELDDMISTTSSALLGVTVACARCHQHKFDPVSPTDYYKFSALFNGVFHGQQKLPTFKGKKNIHVYTGRFHGGRMGPVHRLHRGEPDVSAIREEVTPGLPKFANFDLKLKKNSSDKERRLALAKWLGSKNNHFTARVMVNRIWHYHFGQGLVRTTNDFGMAGEKPSHPELLDWLAAQFIKNDWSIKYMQKLIMSSATWQQSSKISKTAAKLDSSNQLLSRWRVKRMSSENIRDNILLVAGNLDLKPKGPGFNIWKKSKTTNVLNFEILDTYDKRHWRRMIYMLRVRVETGGTFDIFDRPNATSSCGNRATTVTPLQSLNLMNSNFVIQQAKLMAQKTNKLTAMNQAITIFKKILGRKPTKTELKNSINLINKIGAEHLCRALFNCNEFLSIH